MTVLIENGVLRVYRRGRLLIRARWMLDAGGWFASCVEFIPDYDRPAPDEDYRDALRAMEKKVADVRLLEGKKASSIAG